jgi:hypothetical protein
MQCLMENVRLIAVTGQFILDSFIDKLGEIGHAHIHGLRMWGEMGLRPVTDVRQFGSFHRTV